MLVRRFRKIFKKTDERRKFKNFPCENVKIGLPISPMNYLPTHPRSRERIRVQTLSNLVRTLRGVRTRMFIPLVDPCTQKGGDLRGAALESLASL